jgi:hypothetical protein
MEPEGDAVQDLGTQIETLYRVIGQSQPVAGAGSWRNAHLNKGAKQWFHSARWICMFYCLWFSLPLSIWLSSGWIGLLLYWQALSDAACLVEKFTGKQRPAYAGADLSDGDVSCSAIEVKAR